MLTMASSHLESRGNYIWDGEDECGENHLCPRNVLWRKIRKLSDFLYVYVHTQFLLRVQCFTTPSVQIAIYVFLNL